MNDSSIQEIRKLSQLYAYTSLQMHEAVARKAGFAGTDHKYLGFFLQKGRLTAGELSVLTGLTTGAVTGLIDRFEEKGLVNREPDPHDRRKVYIVPDAQKIMAVLSPFYKKFQSDTDKLFAEFSKQELDVIQTYFLKAIKLMNDTKGKIHAGK